MAGPATLKIEIIADAAKAIAGLGKVETAAGKAASGTEKAGSKLGGMAKAAAAAAGAAALGGLVAVFKTGIGEQKDFLDGQAQLANGIKTTGNAANVSVSGLEDLASSIQNYSGQTDDSIVASEKLLLTFTSIHNATGKNNDIFNQATKMTADMAAKMGGDASKYAVQLGKALNDPTKGITALTRVGVTFTDAQKKSIKSMQKSGDTLGAQKVIMAELRKEFGGSAKAAGQTLPGQMKIAQRSFEDVSQSLVASLMPMLTALMGIVQDDLLPAFKALFGFISENMGWIGPLAAGIAILVGAWKAYSLAMTIAKFATDETTQANLKLAASFLTNPIFLVIAALVLLGIGFVILYKKSQTFRDIVNGAMSAVSAAVGAMVRFVSGVIKGLTDFLLHSPIAAVLLGPWRIALGALHALITGGFSGLLNYFRGIGAAVTRALSGVYHAITGAFSAGYNWVHNEASKLWSALSGVAGKIGNALSGVYHAIISPFQDAWNWIKEHIISPLTSAWNGIANAVNSIHISYKIPKWVPGVGGKGFTFDPPNVPTLARGGVVDKATLALIGEGRGREIVAPEALLRQIVAEGGGTTNIYISGVIDKDSAAREIESLLRRRGRRVGGVRLVGAPA